MKRNLLFFFLLLLAIVLLFAACNTTPQPSNEIEEIPEEKEEPHAHIPAWVTDIEPTCTESGHRYQVCTICNKTIGEETVPPTGHTPDEWIVDAEPTCAEDGSRHRLCSVCGELLEEETLFAPGHTEVVDPAVAPTCTESGLTEGLHCSVCGEVFWEQHIRPATGHTPGIWEEDTEPTCTEDGSKHLSCSVCGELLETGTIPFLGHDFGGWGMDTTPTCTDSGTEKRVCTRCGTIEQREIAALGHLYDEWETLTEPTCSTTGSKQRVCIRCDNIETAAIPIAPSNHSWVGDYCEFCGEHKPSDGLIFTQQKDGSYAVSGYSGSDTFLYFPSSYQNKPVTAIGAEAFLGQDTITGVVLPETIVQISYRAFENCYQLETINLPEGLTLIENSAFQWCKSLESVVIPDQVTEVGQYAFYSCYGLKSIHFGKSVSGIGLCALSSCIGLESITVDPENPVYHSAGNCLIETETKELWAGCKTSVIPNDGSVTSIPVCAFYRAVGLTKLNIPRSVTLIGASICADCTGLTDIYYEGTVEEWGEIWKNANWDSRTPDYIVHCENGNIPK